MPTLKEAAADVLHGNVKKKQGQADKAERLPGEVQDLGKAVVEPDESEGPDASVGVKKDSSKSSTSKVKGEGRKKSQSLKGDMQEEEELDEDILDEDGNPIDDDPEFFCDHCGSVMERKIQGITVTFKGSGFYSTDKDKQ